jgi:plasmid replication initiation protein
VTYYEKHNKIHIMKNNIVVKKNEFLKFKYSLSLNEQRLLLACISKIDSRKPLSIEHEFEITVQEMSDLFDENRDNVYRDLKKSCKKLRSAFITTSDSEKEREINWVSTAEYWKDESKVVIVFNNAVLPYLTSITEKFFKYKLADVKDFQSVYSLRFYELLHQFQTGGSGSQEIEIDELRRVLNLEEKYSTFGELKRSVIDKAITEINMYSNLTVSYGERKRGKKVVAIQFAFETKQKTQPLENKKQSSNANIDVFVRDFPEITKGKSVTEVLELMRKKLYDKK